MITRQVSWDKLDDLVPRELDQYWELTFRFLKRLREELAGSAARVRRHRGGGHGATG